MDEKKQIALDAAIDLSSAVKKNEELFIARIYAATALFGILLWSVGLGVPFVFGFCMLSGLIADTRERMFQNQRRAELALIFRKHPDLIAEARSEVEKMKKDKRFWRRLER